MTSFNRAIPVRDSSPDHSGRGIYSERSQPRRSLSIEVSDFITQSVFNLVTNAVGMTLEKLHALSQSMRLDAQRSKLELPQVSSASEEDHAVYESDDEHERGIRQQEHRIQSIFSTWTPFNLRNLLGTSPTTKTVHFTKHSTANMQSVSDGEIETEVIMENSISEGGQGDGFDRNDSVGTEESKMSSLSQETKISWYSKFIYTKRKVKMEDKYPQYAIAKRVIHQNRQLFWVSIFGLIANFSYFIGRHIMYFITGNELLGKPLSVLQILGAIFYFCLLAHRLVAYLIGFIVRRILRKQFWEDSGTFNIHIGWISYRGFMDRQEVILSNVIWLNPPGYDKTPYLLHIKEVFDFIQATYPICFTCLRLP